MRDKAADILLFIKNCTATVGIL